MTSGIKPHPQGPGSPYAPFDTGTSVRVHRPEYRGVVGMVLDGYPVPLHADRTHQRCLYLVELEVPHVMKNGEVQTRVALYNTELEKL